MHKRVLPTHGLELPVPWPQGEPLPSNTWNSLVGKPGEMGKGKQSGHLTPHLLAFLLLLWSPRARLAGWGLMIVPWVQMGGSMGRWGVLQPGAYLD